MGTKYAFVNIQRIAAESSAGKTLAGKVQALNQQKVNELNEKNKALQATQQKLESGASVLSADCRGPAAERHRAPADRHSAIHRRRAAGSHHPADAAPGRVPGETVAGHSASGQRAWSPHALQRRRQRAGVGGSVARRHGGGDSEIRCTGCRGDCPEAGRGSGTETSNGGSGPGPGAETGCARACAQAGELRTDIVVHSSGVLASRFVFRFRFRFRFGNIEPSPNPNLNLNPNRT